MLKNTVATLRALVATVFVLCLAFSAVMPRSVSAAPLLPNRFIRISDSAAGNQAEYTIGFTINEVSTQLGSIRLTFCANSPIIDEICAPAPPGLDVSGAILANQTGNTGFVVSSASANSILLARVPILPVNAASTYRLTNMENPTVPGSQYLRIETFATNDGSGARVEEGGAVFSMNGGVNVTTEVPPYLKLCASVTIVGFNCATATSFLIDLGEFSKTSAKAATSELVIATNAGFGYTITVAGTTLISGNNEITALASGGTSVPGTAQFGINLRANTNPSIGSNPIGPGVASPTANYNIPNTFRFAPADVIVSGSGTTDNKKFTVSYLANVDINQPTGVYATTITYIALANF